jgi:tryptophan halogenase
MKKIIIIGSGSSGLIAAAMLKRFYVGRVKVEIYYDSKKKNIGVGESTTPAFVDFLKRYLYVEISDFIKDTGSTVKLGINFKNWTRNREYFHGFNKCNIDPSGQDYPESLYSIPNGTYNGGILHNNATTKVPSHDFYYDHAFHIDTQIVSQYILNDIEDEIDRIDDVVERVNSDGKSIQSIVFKNRGEVTADFYIRCFWI